MIAQTTTYIIQVTEMIKVLIIKTFCIKLMLVLIGQLVNTPLIALSRELVHYKEWIHYSCSKMAKIMSCLNLEILSALCTMQQFLWGRNLQENSLRQECFQTQITFTISLMQYRMDNMFIWDLGLKLQNIYKSSKWIFQILTSLQWMDII